MDAPVILNEARGGGPGYSHVRLAGEYSGFARKSGEEVLEWRGPAQRVDAEAKSDHAPQVTAAGIALDVRELTAKLQGVLAHQVRDAVLDIPVWIGGGIQRTALLAAE